MKGLMLLANQCEDSEALTTLDILRRASLQVYTAAINGSKTITTQSRVIVEADLQLVNINYRDYDFLIIPGGSAVFKTLDRMPLISEIVKDFISKDKLTCFICAAPHLPGKLGLLEGHTYTCFPGCNEKIIAGDYLPNEKVVVSKNIITARSMAYSIDFALAIVEKLLGKNQKEIIEKNICGLL